MKSVVSSIKNIKAVSCRDFVFAADGGSISLSFLTEDILHISYHFNGIETDDVNRKCSTYMTEGIRQIDSTCMPSTAEKDGCYILTCGKTEVRVEKQCGIISVYRDGVLVHGGRMGDSDTVIPSYPVRCLTKKNDSSASAHFNFPLLKDDEFYGLGDKTGLPDRKGRMFTMHNRDCLGYDASNSDPMYKAIPFLIKRNRTTGALCGLFFDHSLITSVDLGRESPYYFTLENLGGPFSYFVITGQDYHSVIDGYYMITGRPSLPPLFSFGFFGSSMNYVEPDDAADRILAYFDSIEKYNIPCEGLYVSSGYLKAADGKRYAFLWNRKKFPDYKKYLHDLSERGYNLCMNIKPGILVSHPWYKEIAEKGYFIKDENGKPYTEFFWGGPASLIDFTNPDAKEWWKGELEKQYLDHGCTGIWNDNNEFEIEDPGLDAYAARSMLPVLMCQASYEVFKKKAPDKRPWIYSRSGGPGIQRYARTWSGDNTSEWKTLKYNQYMSVGFGLSGLPFYGHDLGGFFGDVPSRELLVRSCQSAVFQGRFVIHSWRANGNPTEPWTYPDALEPIKRLIQKHYYFMPYIYNCAIQTVLYGKPMDRMLSLEFPEDPAVRTDDTNCMYGDYILKALVLDEGKNTVDAYLPAGHGWYDGSTGAFHTGGTTVTCTVPCDDRVQWFAKDGAVIPVSEDGGHLKTSFFNRTCFLLYPPVKEGTETDYYEDDGITELAEKIYNCWQITLTADTVTFRKVQTGTVLSGRTYTARLPEGYYTEKQISFDPDSIPNGGSISFAYRKKR